MARLVENRRQKMLAGGYQSIVLNKIRFLVTSRTSFTAGRRVSLANTARHLRNGRRSI
jgi:hypothetical protein